MTEILLYDAIGAEPEQAQEIVREIRAAESDIDVRINSGGGSVFDGLAIYNQLAQAPGAVTIYVDGIAASIASIIAMAGDRIVMAENASLMIHDPMGPSAAAFGPAELLRQAADETNQMANLLDRIRGNLADIYAARSGQPVATINGWMSEETWFSAEEATAAGLADEVLSNKVIKADKRVKIAARWGSEQLADILTASANRADRDHAQRRLRLAQARLQLTDLIMRP